MSARQALGAFLLGLACAFLVPRAAMGADAPARILVLGPDGGPLSDARLVAAAGVAEGRPVFDPAAETLATSDLKGRITAWDRASTTGSRLVVWAPGAAAALVPATAGGVTVRLMGARSSDGRVRLAAGAAAANVHVLAFPLEAGADLVHRAATDKAGSFRLPALHAGSWDLFLRHRGGRLQRIGRVDAGSSVGDMRLRSATSVRGRLLDADKTRGAAVAGVPLRFVPTEPQPPGRAPPDAVRTEDDGTFLAAGLEEGVYRVELLDGAWAFEPRPPRVQVELGRARQVETWFARRRQTVTGTVVDVDGLPVAGAAVRLVVDPTRPPPPGADGAVSLSVPTDPQGRFAVPRVAPGEGYRLMVACEGYSPWLSNPFRVDWGEPTALKPVRLLRGWRVLVRVRDLDGAPVAGARVTAVSARQPTAMGDPVWEPLAREGTSDETGRLELRDLPSDDVLVAVHAAGFLPAQQVVSYPRVSDVRQADLTLQAAQSLGGRVLPADGGPQGPFLVLANRRDGQGMTHTTTDAKGAFRLTDLADTATDVSVRRADDAHGQPLALVENVLPGVEEHLEIQLPQLRALRGTVEELELGGPAAEVFAETQRFDTARERYVWRVAARAPVTAEGSRGAFVLAGLPPGLYAVRVVQGALDTGTAAVLLDEEDVDDLLLRLPTGARIAGSVLDAESTPLLGARVTLTRWHGEDASPVRAEDALQRIADERGDFVFDGLAPGLWRVEASDEERAPDVEFVRVGDGEVRVVRDLQLGLGGELAGLLEDADGRPLDGVTVLVRRFDGDEPDRIVRTDVAGQFRARHLRAGTWTVRVHAATVAGGPWIEAVVEVEDGHTSTVRFAASEDGAIEGTVRRRGQPVPGAVVDLVHDAPGAGPLRRYRTSTDASGAFTVAQLEAGRYTVQVQSGAWRSEQELYLDPGDSLHLDLEAWEGRLRGIVITRAGDPVPGAYVVAHPILEGADDAHLSGYFAEGRSDPRGGFVLRGLPVGAYTLSVSAPGHPPGRLEVAEADLPGADFEVQVVLGRGGDLELRVVDENDRGVTGALVWLENTQGQALHQTAYVTGAAGRIVIEGVPTGDVRVRVRARGLGRPALRAVRIEEGRQASVVVRVGPAGSIRLVVRGEASDPLGRARIDIVRESTGDVMASRRPLSPLRLASPWGWVPRTGVVVIPDLEAGDYTARVSAGRDYEPASIPIRVENGQVTEVRVTLEPR